MRALWTLTVANIRSYTRDRAALFWTLAFPLIFIVMFGLIFQGGGESRLNLAWVDGDGSPQSAELRAALAGASGVRRCQLGGDGAQTASEVCQACGSGCARGKCSAMRRTERVTRTPILSLVRISCPSIVWLTSRISTGSIRQCSHTQWT